MIAISKCPIALVLIAALALPLPAAANRPDHEAMGRYVRARLADVTGEPIAAAAGYAALLAADPSDAIMAQRAYRGGLSAGDMTLALRAARILDARGALPADGRLLFLAEALGAGDWRTARQIIDRIEQEESFAFLVPILRAWTNFSARDGATTDLLRELPPNALTQAYAAEHRALLLLAEGKEEAGAAAFKALPANGGAAGHAVRIAAASRLAARREREAALSLLSGNDSAIRAARELIRRHKKLPGAAGGASKGVSLLLARLASDINRQSRSPVAISLARTALLLDPGNDAALLLASDMIAAQGSPDIGLALLDRINPKGPWTVAARDQRVQILVDAGQQQTALETALAATQAPDATVEDFSRLGERYAELGRHAEAAAAYDRALALAEKREGGANWALWMLKGSALYESGNWAAAKPALTKAAELGPDQAVVLNYLGYAKLEYREDLDEAQGLIQRANALQPEDAAITDSLGWAYFIRGNIPQAVEALERAAAAAPGEPTINEHLGDAYWAAGRKIDARYAWHAALVQAEDAVATRLKAKLDAGLTPATTAP